MNNEIDIKFIFQVIKEFWLWILIITIIASCAAVIITKNITPMYSSEAKFYIQNRYGDYDYTNSSVIQAAQMLCKSYIQIISSSSFLDGISNKLKSQKNLDYSTEKLKKMISAEIIDESQVFTIKISCESREDAKTIVNMIESNAPGFIAEKEKREDCVFVLDYGELAKEPDSPSMLKNVAIAAVLGFILSYAVFFIRNLTDNLIYTDDDIKNKYTYPVIGVIPSWNN